MTAAFVDDPVVVRLAPCPLCSDRRRTLVESEEGVRGHCLGCGRILRTPLATESMAGRAVELPGERQPVR